MYCSARLPLIVIPAPVCGPTRPVGTVMCRTLAVLSFSCVTAPEVGEIRGVQGTGVLKTLLDRRLIAVAGRRDVIGRPILYKTTREFLIQFGLKDLGELPSLKEFEEIRRMAFADDEAGTPDPQPAPPGE